MIKKRFILGVGGMGREVLSYCIDDGKSKTIKGFVEQNCQRPNEKYKGIRIMDEADLPNPSPEISLISGMGNPIRNIWIKELFKKGYFFEKIVHNSAYIGDNVEIGQGSIICPKTIITNDVQIGEHCIINVNSSISHDCKIGNFATISPGASVGGRVSIGECTWIGIGSTVIQDVKIGNRVFVAAGAVIVDDIPDDSLVIGVPGKVVRTLSFESWKHII